MDGVLARRTLAQQIVPVLGADGTEAPATGGVASDGVGGRSRAHFLAGAPDMLGRDRAGLVQGRRGERVMGQRADQPGQPVGGLEQRLAGRGLEQRRFAASLAQGVAQVGLEFLAAQAGEVVAHHHALGERLVMGHRQVPPQFALADQQQAKAALRVEAEIGQQAEARLLHRDSEELSGDPRLCRVNVHEHDVQSARSLLAKRHPRSPEDQYPRLARLAQCPLDPLHVIGLGVGAVLNRYKVRKHFECTIGDAEFAYRREPDSIAHEAALDGVYVIRTSLAAEDLSAPDCVRSYKALTRVERAFRTLKTADLQVRPIHHRLADRVRAHLFVYLLAYYVEWHMREAWRPLLFADDELAARARTRDPVAAAEPSPNAKRQKVTRRAADGTPLHSFRTLLEDLATITRNVCRTQGETDKRQIEFELDTQLRAEQARALELLKGIRV